MFVQSERFVEAHRGRIGDIAVYGQESNPTTWAASTRTASGATCTRT
jgi:type I restriction-modification system DNA methylase subunit